jgi:hypothetical protein
MVVSLLKKSTLTRLSQHARIGSSARDACLKCGTPASKSRRSNLLNSLHSFRPVLKTSSEKKGVGNGMPKGKEPNQFGPKTFFTARIPRSHSSIDIRPSTLLPAMKNPEGIPALSPRLARISEGLPWVNVLLFHYPERVAHPFRKTITTLSGLKRSFNILPGVARASSLRCTPQSRFAPALLNSPTPKLLNFQPVPAGSTGYTSPIPCTLKRLNSSTPKLQRSCPIVPNRSGGISHKLRPNFIFNGSTHAPNFAR